MKVLIALTLALAPMRAHANGRLTRYARNSSYSTSHPGRCDRNVFERQFYDLAKGLEPTSDKVTAHSYETMYGTFVYPLKFAAHTPRMLEKLEACVIGKRNRHVEGSRPGLPGHDFSGRR